MARYNIDHVLELLEDGPEDEIDGYMDDTEIMIMTR